MNKTTNTQANVPVALTKQREAVLQAVNEYEGHPTANEVYEMARKKLPTISFATVYNSLRYLKDAGLLGEIQFGNGASRYDSILERHDHAICNQCGKLVDLDMELSEELMRLAARRSRFKAESVHLTLRGICPDCSSK